MCIAIIKRCAWVMDGTQIHAAPFMGAFLRLHHPSLIYTEACSGHFEICGKKVDHVMKRGMIELVAQYEIIR